MCGMLKGLSVDLRQTDSMLGCSILGQDNFCFSSLSSYVVLTGQFKPETIPFLKRVGSLHKEKTSIYAFSTL